MDEKLIDRIIEVLELELDTDLDDQAWEDICNDKLDVLIDRIIAVLELELDTDLDDQAWEDICDDKLDMLIDLRKIIKGMHVQD